MLVSPGFQPRPGRVWKTIPHRQSRSPLLPVLAEPQAPQIHVRAPTASRRTDQVLPHRQPPVSSRLLQSRETLVLNVKPLSTLPASDQTQHAVQVIDDFALTTAAAICVGVDAPSGFSVGGWQIGTGSCWRLRPYMSRATASGSIIRSVHHFRSLPERCSSR